MQDRYAGDVGDFGKLGLLRRIANTGLTVGVNWYLTPNETHNNDGKHIGYFSRPTYNGCDDELKASLENVAKGERNVATLEKKNLLPNATYYHEVLFSPSQSLSRIEWHMNALQSLRNVDVVFLDPDNGQITKSATSNKSNKYVLPQEICDYYADGKSVIYYNHRCREAEDVYLRRFDWLHEEPSLEGSSIIGISFHRGTVRDYIIVLQPSHADQIAGCVDEMLQGPWGRHFTKLAL